MWVPTKTKKYGVAIYNWRGDTRYGLPLEIGDTIQILEECEGWYRGFATKNRTHKGIFPQNYVFLKQCKVDNEGLFESVVPVEDPVVREVTLVLREWGRIWKDIFVLKNHYKFETVGKVMRDLLEWRRQLVSGTLTHDQTRELKIKIIQKIDWGNRKLGLDLVPRQGANMVEPDSMSVVELYHVHVSSAENTHSVSARGTIKKRELKKTLTHHLYFCMRDFGHHIGEDTEVYFSLYDAGKQKYLSERFLVKISKEGFTNHIEKLHSNCTVFTDLGNSDLNKDIYVVAHVMRIGKMLYSDSSKKTEKAAGQPQLFRRPHGIGVQNIGEFLTSKSEDNEEKEISMKVYQGEDKDFHQLHEFIIRQSGKVSVLSGPINYGIMISLKMLHGELRTIREENPLLFKNVSLTSKLGFPDVIMPGDVRNDLYLILDKGEFERGGKSTGKNIEVAVVVLDGEKNVVKNCLWGASGIEGVSEYNSMIIYHHNSPAWAENIRLTLPIDKFAGAHIRLEYRHCSTREKNDKKLFGFSFMRLMDKDGAAVQDGQHELYIYKCEDVSKLENCGYLALPAFSKDYEGNHEASGQFSRSHKELISIKTLLCSTKLTQNVDLLALLRWKSHPERIQESLQRVLKLGDEELIKFLQDVLDALFALFSTEDGNSTPHSGLVFHVLVSIFNLLDGSKYQHFKPVLDAYIKNHFAAALVYKGLLTSVQHCADWVVSFEKIELRKATLHIFFDMMECEQRARGNFRQVECELIDKLDILISDNKGDDEYRRLFNTILLDRVQSEDPTWKESGAAFISSITRLLERLLDYRNVIQGDENRDKRMSCTFNLLKLHDLHLSAENYTEAAYTMKLYADQLSWSNSQIVSDPNYPNHTECQVKELLYRQIINYFDKGKCWEKGIPLLKELANLYESLFFDYRQLSDILKCQAKFYDNILTLLRPEPEYFRVGFYGLSFPLFVRNKQFIYRGLEYERIGAFTQRLQTEFPSAQILMKNTPPDDSIINSDGQFIQITNVKPIPEITPITTATDIPEKISRFYHYNDVKKFQCDRPVHKGITDKENEIKTMWIERTVVETAAPLPGILRWFEVIDRQTEEIPPVQFACETMRNVENELRQLIAVYTHEPKRNLNPFTMRLQGIIDANVQGGLSKYQQAFFTKEFAKLYPEHKCYVNTLQELIWNATTVIEEGLYLHGKLAPVTVQPLHQRLIERFLQLRESLGSLSQHSANSIIHTPLPPVPSEKRVLMENGSNRSSNSSGNYGHLIEPQTMDYECVYTKSNDVERPSLNRENLSLPMGSVAPPIPQRECRPRSQGFNNTSFSDLRTPTRCPMEYNSASLPSMKSRESDSCDVPLPPKPTHSRERSLTKPPSPRLLRHAMSMTPTDGTSPLRNSWPDTGIEEAPPLPPRSHTPDKRVQSLPNDVPPNVPKRGQKKATPSICSAEYLSTDDATGALPSSSEGDLVASACSFGAPSTDTKDLRDSGISMNETSSNISHFNTQNCYDDFELRPHPFELTMSSSPPNQRNVLSKEEHPPPIPPKIGGSLNSSLDFGGSLERPTRSKDLIAAISDILTPPENYSHPKLPKDNEEDK
uniref:Dedicator of cytokinesis protein 3 n=1 Tax=Dendroctonus ponderosae TaxID=77166 RepID=A0AAR5PSM5_DENPD